MHICGCEIPVAGESITRNDVFEDGTHPVGSMGVTAVQSVEDGPPQLELPQWEIVVEEGDQFVRLILRQEGVVEGGGGWGHGGGAERVMVKLLRGGEVHHSTPS